MSKLSNNWPFFYPYFWKIVRMPLLSRIGPISEQLFLRTTMNDCTFWQISSWDFNLFRRKKLLSRVSHLKALFAFVDCQSYDVLFLLQCSLQNEYRKTPDESSINAYPNKLVPREVFAPLWIFICFFTPSNLALLKSHASHSYGFSPVYVLKCCFSILDEGVA